MRKRMIRKLLSFVLCTVFLSMSMYSVSLASSTNEIESNDVVENATIINAHRQTMAEYCRGNTSNSHRINGSLGSADVDWYAVQLNAGEQRLSCIEGRNIEYEIYDSSLSLLRRVNYDNSKKKGYLFWAQYNGTYYVKVQAPSVTYVSYSFTIGNPIYDLGMVQIACPNGSITMNARQSTATLVYLGDPSIPEGAIATCITMGGVRSKHGMETINVVNLSTNKRVVLSKYLFEKDNIVSLEIPCESDWNVTFQRDSLYTSSSVTFSPSIDIRYIYPIGE